ncbi:uncharacterized protein LOC144127755 [Amblyomma americanum]
MLVNHRPEFGDFDTWGIANLCFRNALNRSCFHTVEESLMKQTARLGAAGYPSELLVSVAEGVLKEKKAEGQTGCNQQKGQRDDKQKVVVIPYMHKISHNLKKIAKKADVKVVFSAPEKLIKLCKATNPMKKPRPGCKINHQNPFVACDQGVVYEIKLTCGSRYIGQAGRCLNERLLEHNNNVRSIASSGFLAKHCHRCNHKPACIPDLHGCKILARNKCTITREIIEARAIAKAEDSCVSTPSILLSTKEMEFLDMRR